MMNFKLPFPDWTLTTSVKISKVKLSEDGEPVPTDVLFEGKARYDEKSKQLLNANRELVLISGTVVCKGDLSNDVNTGKEPLLVLVNGIEKRVMSVNRPKNPDGSVFSTELTLI